MVVEVGKEVGLWQDIVRQKYAKNSCVSQLKGKQSNLPAWNDLLSIREYYLRGRKIKIGKWGNVDCWQDVWCGSTPLKEQFPTLFEICNEQNITVAKIAQRNWRFTFRRWLDTGLQEQLRSLRDILFSCALNDEDDLPIWKWEKSGSFSMKSMYSHLCSNEVGIYFKDIWKAKMPLKIKIWMWLINHNAILTKDNLLKRNWSGDLSCAFCNETETIPHIFFECPLAKYIWSMVAHVLGATCRPTSFEQY